MKNSYIRTSPWFFRRIKRCLLLVTLILLLLALVIPAPLQEQASIARVPNPVKSAWFLLWIQELVSYSKYLVNLVLGVTILAVLLPWLPGVNRAEAACWFPHDQKIISILTIVSFMAIIGLTVVAMFFRGPNWALCFPF